ncbi:hypothetical protein GE09DRAFT_1138949 [Coniochaeta sp. 2T2.1]|nr:hypothetical protein GE09DRAFT_1138949 [Coniochaeta sp. 2T2.1]
MTRGGVPPPGLSRRHHFLGSVEDVAPEMLAQINWDDRSTRRALILTVIIVCMTFIVVFVTTRLLVRRLITRQFFLDDTLITIASLFTLGLCIVSLLALHVGFGQHVWAIPLPTVLPQIKSCVQLMFMANIFYATAITFTKLSIIASYLRIFPYQTLRYLMYVTAAVTLGLFIASVPATIFQCSPISAAWDFDLTQGEDNPPKCYTFVNFLYATTGVNVVSDLVLCCAPLPYFWRLQMARRQKFIVSGLFFIGGFACVASITRLTYLHLIQTSIDVTCELQPLFSPSLI